MKPEQREELKQAAQLYKQQCETRRPLPVAVSDQCQFYAEATPDAILSLIAQVEALTVQQAACNKILREVLETVESSEHWWMDVPNRGGFDVEAISSSIAAAPTIPAIPGTKEGS